MITAENLVLISQFMGKATLTADQIPAFGKAMTALQEEYNLVTSPQTPLVEAPEE